MAAPAAAHDWYPRSCCSGYDCAPVPEGSVSVADGEALLALRPGAHPMAPQGGVWTIPADRLRPSPDGQPHACIAPGGARLICLFAWFGG